MKKLVFLLFLMVLTSTVVQAQWYFETGVNGTKFTEYVNLVGEKTTLHSYNGFRDFSFAFGHTIPFKSLDKLMESNGKASLFRLGIGIGFDQMNLRTLAQMGNTNIPINYNMAQAKAELNILITPTLISKNDDATAVKRPVLNLLIEAGVAYNIYTSATRSYFYNKGYTSDLKADNTFTDVYPTYSFAGGLESQLAHKLQFMANM